MNKLQVNINVYRFFQGYVWDFRTYPDYSVSTYFSRKKVYILDLSDITGTTLFDDIKDIFMCAFSNKEPYAYTSKSFPYLFSIKDFILQSNYNDFSDINNVKNATSEWTKYWSNKGLKYLHSLKNVIASCKFTLLEYRDTRIGLDRNFWRYADLKINKERLNKSREFNSINFWLIENEENRNLTKIWFKYLIGSTEMSYTTIYNMYNVFYRFVNHIDISLLEVTHENVERFIGQMTTSADYTNHLLTYISDFYKYMQVKKIYDKKIPVMATDYMKVKNKYVHNTVSDYTILEIFRNLHTLPDDLLLIYLINLFTGIRISDICMMTTDCLYTSEHGYFLMHNCQKMQNVGAIPISKELYDLIQNRIESVNEMKYKYLFPSARNKSLPSKSSTYRCKMQY